MKISHGIIILFVATFLSFLIANIPTSRYTGLAFLMLWFWPPFLGVLGIIIFLLTSVLTKRKTIRLAVIMIWCVYLIYVGLGLYIDKGWPFIIW